jgi:hypothetical protein
MSRPDPVVRDDECVLCGDTLPDDHLAQLAHWKSKHPGDLEPADFADDAAWNEYVDLPEADHE